MKKPYNPKTYWNRLSGEEMKLSEVGWPQWTEAYNGYRYKLSLEQVSRLIEKTCIHAKKILEVGCGVGFWTHYLTTRFPDSSYHGIDISHKAIQKLRTQYADHPYTSFKVADISTFSFNKTRYDLIVCFEVLLHIIDDRLWNDAIINMSRALSPDGYLLVSDPFNAHGEPPDYKQGGHCRIRKMEDFKRLIEKQNLEVIQIYPRTFFLDGNCDFRSAWALKLWNLFFRGFNRMLSIKWEPLGHMIGYLAYLFDKWYSSGDRLGHACKLIVIKPRLKY